MPSEYRLQVLESWLNEAGIAAQIDERDIYMLDNDERTLVMDAMINDGAVAPMVLVNGRIVCTDGIDIAAAVEAAREAASISAG